jgi:hypothetical protein
MRPGDPCKFEELNVGDIFKSSYNNGHFIKVNVTQYQHLNKGGNLWTWGDNNENEVPITYIGFDFPTLIKNRTKESKKEDCQLSI